MQTTIPRSETECLVAREDAPESAHPTRRSRLDPRWPLYVVYFGQSWVIARIYWRLTLQLETATIWDMVGGVARAPFQYRILMPWIMGLISRVTGVDDVVLIDVGLRTLVMFGVMVLTRRWLRHFVHPVLADVGPLLLGTVLLGTLYWYWPYDFSGILLWTAALVALVERRYALYLLLFVIGTVNRETTALLVGIFLTTQWETLGARRALRWAGLQVALFAAIYIGLHALIRPDSGGAIELHWLENIGFLLGQNHISAFENWMSLLAAVGFLWLLASWRPRTKSSFLIRSCWILPVHAVIIFVTGRLAEPRLWSEWVPVVMALAGQNLMELTRSEQERPPAESTDSATDLPLADI